MSEGPDIHLYISPILWSDELVGIATVLEGGSGSWPTVIDLEFKGESSSEIINKVIDMYPKSEISVIVEWDERGPR